MCVNTREQHRNCCAAEGSAEIIPALRRELVRRGRTAAHIDVRPSECVRHCGHGATLVAVMGKIAEQPWPPLRLDDHVLRDAELILTQVRIDQVPAIVDNILKSANGEHPLRESHVKERD